MPDSIQCAKTLLEILSGQPDTYVSKNKIKQEFQARLNHDGNLDNVALDNSLTNAINDAWGLNELSPTDRISSSPNHNAPQTAEYIGAIAQVRQIKLIDKQSGSDSYRITIRGTEFLNQIRLSESSQSLEWLTSVLILLGIPLILVTLPNIADTMARWYVFGSDLHIVLLAGTLTVWLLAAWTISNTRVFQGLWRRLVKENHYLNWTMVLIGIVVFGVLLALFYYG